MILFLPEEFSIKAGENISVKLGMSARTFKSSD